MSKNANHQGLYWEAVSTKPASYPILADDLDVDVVITLNKN